MPNSSARRETSTPPATCTRSSDACWPGSLRRCGGSLGSPEQIEILELGPGRGLFAQDVLDWSEKKFPQFFGALHYSLVERSPALRERLLVTLSRHFDAGKASLPQRLKPSLSKVPTEPALQRALAPEVPLIVFANEFFDALPVEVLSPQGALRISEKDGHFIETWVPGLSGGSRFPRSLQRAP